MVWCVLAERNVEDMGEAVNKVDGAKKQGFWKSLKSEFKKITCPDRQSLVKQTIAVSVITVILGVLIAGVDTVFKYGIAWLLKL